MNLPFKVGHKVWFVVDYDYSGFGVIETITKENNKTIYTVKNEDIDYPLVTVIIPDAKKSNPPDMIVYCPSNRPYYGVRMDDLVHDYKQATTPPNIKDVDLEVEKEIKTELNIRGLEIFNNQGLFLIEKSNTKRLKVVTYG